MGNIFFCNGCDEEKTFEENTRITILERKFNKQVNATNQILGLLSDSKYEGIDPWSLASIKPSSPIPIPKKVVKFLE